VALTNAYGTLQQLRAAAGITDANNTDHDPALEIAGNSAARMIDSHCGRRFWQDSVVQTVEFDADEHRCLELPGQFEISTTTGLIVKVDSGDDGTYETTLTLNSDFVLRRPYGKPTTWPYTQIRLTPNSQVSFPLDTAFPAVQITAKFGWPGGTVPADVLEAWIVQAVQLYKSDAAPFGGVSVGLDGGVLRLGARLHPIAEGLLETYRRVSV
jgi:hypothetical protein